MDSLASTALILISTLYTVYDLFSTLKETLTASSLSHDILFLVCLGLKQVSAEEPVMQQKQLAGLEKERVVFQILRAELEKPELAEEPAIKQLPEKTILQRLVVFELLHAEFRRNPR